MIYDLYNYFFFFLDLYLSAYIFHLFLHAVYFIQKSP